jgi:hypothetical protein
MRRCLLPLLLSLAACFPRASVPEGERERAARELEGQLRYAKVALFLGPLYGDDRKLLVSDQPVEELDLLENVDGKPIQAPQPDRVILPGTPLRVRAVEFPTGWIIASRVVMTPRYHPWVYLELPDDQRPAVVVLSQLVASADDVKTELERYVGTVDASQAFRALPEVQRAAIALKRPLDGMGPQALELAWGYPEKKVIDRPAGTEEWSWSEGRRKASLRDGKLVRWSVEGEAR